MEVCDRCGQFASLYHCKVTDDQATKYMDLCDNCVVEIRSSVQLMILGKDDAAKNSPAQKKEQPRAEHVSYYSPKESGVKQGNEAGQQPNYLFWIGILWIVVSIIYYFSSSQKLDRESARVLGVDSVANFQGTLFTIGAFLAGVLHIIGGVIVKEIRAGRKQ